MRTAPASGPMAEYRPIDCAIHDRDELAIIRRRRLRLSWRDDAGEPREGVVRPTDLTARGGEEFLSFVDAAGTRHEIRLDRVRCVPGAEEDPAPEP